MLSCGHNESKENGSNAVSTKTEAIQEPLIKDLKYRKFVKNIWDFEKYPDSFAFEGNKPCIVEFYATWCGPCKKVKPVIERLAEHYNDKIDFYQVDVDSEKKLSAILKIENIPTVLFFPEKGQPLKRVGALSEEQYISDIKKYILK